MHLFGKCVPKNSDFHENIKYIGGPCKIYVVVKIWLILISAGDDNCRLI